MLAGRPQLRMLTLCLIAAGGPRPVAVPPGSGSDTAPGQGAIPVRLAFSEKVVNGVNLSDARAAMGVWADEVLKSEELKVTLAPGQNWVMTTDKLLGAIRGGTVDLFCLSVQEYRQVVPYVDATRIVTNDMGGEEFLLVVREGAGIMRLGDLRGRSLILQDSSNTILAEPWLAVALWREGLDSPDRLMARISTNTKVSKVVLPVFFGQADACVVTRRGLDTMAELNPQVARKLKILLVSPKMESTIIACRKGYPAQFKERLFERILALRQTAAAQQALVLFQSHGFAEQDASCLKSAFELLDEYDRHNEPGATRKR